VGEVVERRRDPHDEESVSLLLQSSLEESSVGSDELDENVTGNGQQWRGPPIGTRADCRSAAAALAFLMHGVRASGALPQLRDDLDRTKYYIDFHRVYRLKPHVGVSNFFLEGGDKLPIPTRYKISVRDAKFMAWRDQSLHAHV